MKSKKNLILILNTVPLLGLLFWPMLLIGSFFIFDAPGSAKSIPTRMLAWSIWLYPVTLAVGFFGSKWAGKSHKYISAGFFTLVSYSCIIVFAAALAILMISCDGKFSCS